MCGFKYDHRGVKTALSGARTRIHAVGRRRFCGARLPLMDTADLNTSVCHTVLFTDESHITNPLLQLEKEQVNFLRLLQTVVRNMQPTYKVAPPRTRTNP